MDESGCRAVLDANGDSYTVLRAVREEGRIADWIVVDANALVRERWGWMVGDVVGMRASALNLAADNSDFEALYAAALATGEPQEAELELVLPAGRDGWRRTLVVPLDGDTIAVSTREAIPQRGDKAALKRPGGARKALAGRIDRQRTRSVGETEGESKLLAGSAAALFVSAGVVTIGNSYFSSLPGVDVQALRITGVITLLTAVILTRLPWARYAHLIGPALAVAAIGFLVVSDHFDHYSRASAAAAQYPVFFIVIVTWSGLTRIPGTATVMALLSGAAVAYVMGSSGRTSIGLGCAVVTMPVAAALGEVLSWAHRRVMYLTRLEARMRLRDPLTGLANRQLFMERTDAALAGVRRHRRPLAVIFIDLDRFKHVNDSLGHGAGDELLVEAAARLSGAVRESDAVARFGGDEFAVLCDGIVDPAEVSDIAERILESLSRPFTCRKHDVYLTASAGIAVATKGVESAEQLLQDADAAMYRAKDAGRAGFAVFDESMQHMVAKRLEMEGALRQAVANGELLVHYQPVVACTSRSVVGFEALVRWMRPGGMVSPGEFIPIAEETGIVVDIGAWVLHESCLRAAEWAARWPDRRLGVSVNVSSRQLLRGGIMDLVRDCLRSTGLEPARLTLELTETTLVGDALSAQMTLSALRDLGVRIALDDFGTGYSSLTYLRTFPIDVIKIDGSFVRTLGEPQGAAIVGGISSLAKSLDMTVVAEGVETPAQECAAAELGCDFLQGFLFSRPVPAEEIDRLLETRLGVAAGNA